jgi:hypothetical protein
MTCMRLRGRDWLALVALIVIGRGWIAVDQAFLPQRALMPVFLALLVALMAGFFVCVRPAQPLALARTLAVTLGPLVAVLIVIQHVIVGFDLNYKHGIVLGSTLVVPFVVAGVYGLMRG